MATFARLNSGRWRAQVRRKGRYAADTFLRRRDAEMWALEVERAIDLGQATPAKTRKALATFKDLIDLHERDLHEVREPIRRSRPELRTAAWSAVADLLRIVR